MQEGFSNRSGRYPFGILLAPSTLAVKAGSVSHLVSHEDESQEPDHDLRATNIED